MNLRMITFLTWVIMLTTLSVQAQISKYTTHSGELIFSFADYNINGKQINSPVRFTCFFHYGSYRHLDVGRFVGLYTGLGIRNVGFTSSIGDTTWKRRNYYVGIPLAIKLGNLKNDNYLYAGVEGEIGLNYKEKLFINNVKRSKFNEWLSDRTPLFMPSVFAGINFRSGFNIRFKYYLNDFLKKDYTENGVKIYQDTRSNIYYFSVCYNVRHSAAKRKIYNSPPPPEKSI